MEGMYESNEIKKTNATGTINFTVSKKQNYLNLSCDSGNMTFTVNGKTYTIYSGEWNGNPRGSFGYFTTFSVTCVSDTASFRVSTIGNSQAVLSEVTEG